MENNRTESLLMIPKYRYDEVNRKYKETKQALEEMKRQAGRETKETEQLRDEVKRLRLQLDHQLINLQVKETFVEGGILKSQYESIIPKMTCRDEEKLELAEAIVELIKNQQQEKR